MPRYAIFLPHFVAPYLAIFHFPYSPLSILSHFFSFSFLFPCSILPSSLFFLSTLYTSILSHFHYYPYYSILLPILRHFSNLPPFPFNHFHFHSFISIFIFHFPFYFSFSFFHFPLYFIFHFHFHYFHVTLLTYLPNT
jgi:hypothetical protein